MAQDKRWRFNPFLETYNPVTITGESHTIAYIPEFDAYGIFCDEAIQWANPSTVTIAGYTEVSRLSTPAGTQFRVDYADDNFWNTGFIEFHSSKNGNTVSVNYQGLGTLLHPSFRTNTAYNVAGVLTVESTTESNSPTTGATIIDGGMGAAGNGHFGGSLSANMTLFLTNSSNQIKAFLSQNDTNTNATFVTNAYTSAGLYHLREAGYSGRLLFDNINGNTGIYESQNGAADDEITYTEMFRFAAGGNISQKKFTINEAGGNVTPGVSTPTPSFTNFTENTPPASSVLIRYLQIINTVSFSGIIKIGDGTGGPNASPAYIDISPPIASNFAVDTDVVGTVSFNGSDANNLDGFLQANTASNKIRLYIVSDGSAPVSSVSFSGHYVIQ